MRQFQFILTLVVFGLTTACGGPTQDPLGDQAAEDDNSSCSKADADGDGWSECDGDCDDSDPGTYWGAPELEDGKDNDCDGIADNNLATVDDDGDGYSEVDGDCNDDEPLVSPAAVEVGTIVNDNGEIVAEGTDNDCDGNVDEALASCDSALGSTANDHAKAMELCSWVQSATFNSGSKSQARNIVGSFGDVYVPHFGDSMAVLSTGNAVDSYDFSFESPNGGTDHGNFGSHPDPQPDPADGCGAADPTSVYDYLELTFEIEVPSNAKALSYDFNFMSGEFPEWVCTQFDDTFVAILESSSFTGNISFDDAGRPVTINIGFFDVCPASSGGDCAGDSELAGTGHEGGVGGGTGWLTTTAPVTPGEVITLRFIIFDEGDAVYDSLVLLDNFRWQGAAVDGPITVEREQAPIIHGQRFDEWQRAAR